ncbi:hypothetical protein Tco_0693320 [Tanacetum coccineum]
MVCLLKARWKVWGAIKIVLDRWKSVGGVYEGSARKGSKEVMAVLIQSNKSRNSYKPVEKKSHSQKPSRQIFTGHRFSPYKTSAVYEKTSPRSDLRWKPTCRIFKTADLRWIPTGKLFKSCTSKADSESTHGSNVDISKIHECKQTLDLSAGTSVNVQKEQSFYLSAGKYNNVKQENLRVWLLKKLISQKPVLKWIYN